MQVGRGRLRDHKGKIAAGIFEQLVPHLWCCGRISLDAQRL
jgi:hypothetical protein